MPETFYTQEEYEQTSKPFHNILFTLERIDRDIGIKVERPKKQEIGYKLIPSNPIEFLNSVRAVIKHSGWEEYHLYGKKFCDAGCGIGTKLILAKALKLSAEGIEINKDYIKKGKEFYNLDLIEADLLKYKKYKKYDIIYFYVPLNNSELQRKFEKLVAKHSKVGAYIIPFDCGETFEKSKSFKKIKAERRIFKKIKSYK